MLLQIGKGTLLYLQQSKLLDPWLLSALAAGLFLGLQGFTWGKYDCLNLDRMGLRNMAASDRSFLHPKDFFKPPFYTYMNHFLARLPAEVISRNLIRPDKVQRKQTYLRLRLGIARTLNLGFFAGSVLIVFSLVKNSYGLPSARIASLILATSAGFIPYQIFLTTDMALVFMMLASFVCAVRIVNKPDIPISAAAGLLAGLATATKYNGLLVAIALPVAHLLASRGNPVLACLKRPAAWICGLAVPFGFLLGNPYALFDWPRFSSDFLFNYKVTPVYNGVTNGNSYETFFRDFGEIFGWPGTWIVIIGTIVGIFSHFFFHGKKSASLWLLTAVVFVAYTLKIGAFPRMETRFVLPVAPFALILASAGFPMLLHLRLLTIPLLALVLFYNLSSGWWIGELFRKDPRMDALAFAGKNVSSDDKVELSSSIPRLQDLPGRKLQLFKIPTGIERDRNFAEIFREDEQMQEAMARVSTKEGPEWFSPEARTIRNPDWIFWSTIDVEGVAKARYEDLFKKESGYTVVFDGKSPQTPWWVYPKYTEFLRNRTTVWEKSERIH